MSRLARQGRASLLCAAALPALAQHAAASTSALPKEPNHKSPQPSYHTISRSHAPSAAPPALLSASALRSSANPTRSGRSPQRRHFSSEQKFRTQHGSIKVNLAGKHAVGIAQSRGERPYQEDRYAVTSLLVPLPSLKRNVGSLKDGAGWVPQVAEGYAGEDDSVPLAERARQVAYFGVFDGHGGKQVSEYLHKHLHGLLENTKVEDIPGTITEYRSVGGYLKRYRGGPLERFREEDSESNDRKGIALHEMAVLAFLQADNALLADESTGKAGSVATVALLHSLDSPHTHPFYASSLLSLTIAHLGDTRAILASSRSGRAHALTENHHADSRVESERLRKTGTGIVTDSFGETRWGGTLANTRGFGDREFKQLGVIAEPEITKRVLRGEEWAFLVLVSDGITDVAKDDEIVDLVRGVNDPHQAAKKILSFAEDLGSEDNMTVVLVPLPGWGKMGGVDGSAERRKFKLRNVQGNSSRQKRM